MDSFKKLKNLIKKKTARICVIGGDMWVFP